jgi:hypothetical protein
MKPVPPNANPSETIHLGQQSPLTRLLVEQAILMAQELEAVVAKAPKGEVFDHCEEAAITKGRELIRKALEKTAQEYLAAQEKKRRCGPAIAEVAVVTVAQTKKPS